MYLFNTQVCKGEFCAKKIWFIECTINCELLVQILLTWHFSRVHIAQKRINDECLMNRYLHRNIILACLIVLGCVKCKKKIFFERIHLRLRQFNSVAMYTRYKITDASAEDFFLRNSNPFDSLLPTHEISLQNLGIYGFARPYNSTKKKIYNRIITKDSQRSPIFSNFLSAPQITFDTLTLIRSGSCASELQLNVNCAYVYTLN